MGFKVLVGLLVCSLALNAFFALRGTRSVEEPVLTEPRAEFAGAVLEGARTLSYEHYRWVIERLVEVRDDTPAGCSTALGSLQLKYQTVSDRLRG